MRNANRRKASFALAAVISLGLAGCVSAGDEGSKSLDDYYQQNLDWSSCGANQCAVLKVPKNYDDLSADEFDIELLKHPASGQSQGSLVVNPGGPGGSGVDYSAAAPFVLSASVNKVYDTVGFDPRGVGKSDPVNCLTDQELDARLAADGLPEDQAQVDELKRQSEEFGQRCEQKSPDIYPYMETNAVLKDLDILRAALGDDKLNYLGKSYGTYIGALYANEFPDKVGRVVLDGVLDPSLDSAEIGLGQAKGFEDILRRYVADCQKQSNCPVAGKNVDAGVKKIEDLLNSLAEKPLPALPDRPLTQSLGLGSILNYLYFPSYGDWEALSKGLREAFAGNGKELLQMYDSRLERSPDGHYANNSQQAFYAVSCLDRPAESDTAVLQQRSTAWAQQSPTFGAFFAWSDLVCGVWPTPPKGGPQTVVAEGAAPILIVTTTHDPATPEAWAQSLNKQLADSEIVTWDADGHTAYKNGSNCVDKVVDEYFLTGKMPAKSVDCPAA